MGARRAAMLSGMRSVLPILVGLTPFAMVAGAAMVSVGLSPLEAQAMSLIVFAGVSQLAMVELMGHGTPAAIVVLTCLVINLRMIMYSAALRRYLDDVPRRWRAALSYLITDQAFAVAVPRFVDGSVQGIDRGFFLAGAMIVLWSTWQLGTAAGAILGARIPASWSLEFAVPLTIIALVIPGLKDRGTVAAGVAAGGAALALTALPLNLGLLVAAVLGIGVGMIAEGRQP